MISVYSKNGLRTKGEGEVSSVELRGLSTDEKPTTGIENGSMFIEMDTGKIYLYDLENEQWREI